MRDLGKVAHCCRILCYENGQRVGQRELRSEHVQGLVWNSTICG